MTQQLQFFVVGAQKSGTTALDRFLRLNPALQMPKKKELHFFDDDEQDWSAPNYASLHAAFDPPAPGRQRGEVTPMYLYWPPCLERILAYNPAARIIVGLRHPTFRAFSQWKMATQAGDETRPFSEVVEEEIALRASRKTDGLSKRFSYVGRSLYAEQITRVLGLFPRQRVFFFKTDELWKDPGAIVGDIETFLAVPHANLAKRKYIVPLKASGGRPLDEDTRRRLDDFLSPVIVETARLTGLDLSDWLLPSYREPMSPKPKTWWARLFPF